MQETWVQSLGWEDPLEKGTATHSSVLLGESHGQRSLVGYSPWGYKESDTTEQLHVQTSNCAVLSHSVMSDSASPWTEEPGGLQSMGLQRVGHD